MKRITEDENVGYLIPKYRFTTRKNIITNCMLIPCQALIKRRCNDYPAREYMTGENPAWKCHTSDNG